MKNILVIGSINMDMVITTARLPKLGETVSGYGFETVPGGKGANQAVAASRLGAAVKMLGCVGSDIPGKALLNNLEACKIDTTGVLVVPGSSGVAVITVCGGDNHIILDEGANRHVTPELIDQNIALIDWADAVLLQLEIPLETVLYAAKTARSKNKTVILNPAPMRDISAELLKNTDILVPNQHEAEQLLGVAVTDIASAKTAVSAILEKGVKQAVITLGEMGCVYNNGGEITHRQAFPADVKDTTAAGDCFIGALATALQTDEAMDDAILFATAASAITVSRKGASSSIPSRDEVQTFLDA